MLAGIEKTFGPVGFELYGDTWHATCYCEFEDWYCPIGTGRTKEQALANLRAQLREREK